MFHFDMVAALFADSLGKTLINTAQNFYIKAVLQSQ